MNLKERDNKVLLWLQISSELDKFKQKEMQLRKELASYVIGENIETLISEVRTSTLKLGNGYGIKAETTINYKLDETERVLEIIEEMRLLGLSDVSEQLFKWKPTLSESNYRKLSPEAKAIVDQVLTIKAGAPKVEFITPKVN